MSYLLDALLHLGLYSTPAHILELGTGVGKGKAPQSYTAIVSNPPFTGAATLTDTPQPLWSDTDIANAYERAFERPPDVHILALLRWIRDTYEAERAALHEGAAAALGWLDEIYPAAIFDGSSGDEGPVRIVAIRENLRRALQERVP